MMFTFSLKIKYVEALEIYCILSLKVQIVSF